MAESQEAFDYAEPHEAAIRKALTDPRLWKYNSRSGHQFPFTMQWYLWNARLAKAFQFPLQVLEVTIRNAIVDHLRLRGAPAEWAFDKETIDRLERCDAGIRELLNKSKRQLLSKALPEWQYATVKALPDTQDITSYGRIGTNDVIANMSFDFWARLLGSKFERDWQLTLRTVFPNADLIESRRSIWSGVKRVKELRNRVAHHEPIFQLADLQEIHAEILRLTGLRCTTTKTWLQHFSTFQSAFKQMPGTWKAPGDQPIDDMLHPVLEATDPSVAIREILGPLSNPDTWGIVRQNGQIALFGHADIARWVASWADLGIIDLDAPLTEMLERAAPRHRTIAVTSGTTVSEAGARFFERNVPSKSKPTAMLVTSDGTASGNPIGILLKENLRARR
ncbi:hypothetical protein FJ546_06025 [Mesorhizobium sp. B2-4-19]|uniref:Abi family protein n=1 Tax=Mesorhizobium sp. B2-4-19 TaxID=2589930 RepID=UPI00112DB791|nr:Abi family protein [Mesorhizobium sp. B2-4-19]TPK66330.1 hypothetical protein FJ546_06025 [Mesorhizobium sp. B2-4-19]